MSFRLVRPPLTLTTAVMLAAAWASGNVRALDRYHVESTIPAQSKYWDYSSINADRRELYLGRLGGVLAVNLDTHAVTETLFPGELIHAVLSINGHLLVAADGPKNELKVFDVSTNAMRATVAVGGHPDAIAVDARTKTVVTVNKESQDLTLVDTDTWTVRATIKLPGDPEFAVTDDHGRLYVNLADKGRIAAVDLETRRIVGNHKLQGCRDPSGIAFHRQFALVISVCGNGLVKFLSAPMLQEVASVAVGRGADAVLLDEARTKVFIPAGDDGTLSVLSLRSATEVVLEDTLKTEKGAASGAVDAASGRVYLPTGRRLREPATAGGWRPPHIAQGSFHILVIAPGISAPR
jgi:DNA-binding beta-propeller fold protein YncE